MSSPASPLWDFCGFVNGSSFRPKNFMDESTMTLTPCGEFAFVIGESLPLLFFSIYTLMLVSSGFVRYEEPSAVSRLFTLKVIISVLTVISMTISFPVALLTTFHLKPVLLIDWTRTRGLTISTFFASKMFYLITLNRWLLYGFKDPRTYILFALSLVHMVGSVGNVIEWRKYKAMRYRRAESDGYVQLHGCADESAGFFSRIFFCWTNILIQKGGKLQLHTIDDVFQLPPSLEVAKIEREMVENSPTFYSDGQHYSLSSALLSTYGLAFFSLAILRLASDGFTFAGPILLHVLVEILEDPTPNSLGYLYASLMVVCSFLAALFSANFTFYMQKISLKVRAATVTAIYDKLLMVPISEMSKFSSGMILNFISTDVDRIVNFCNSFHAFWSLPVQLGIALYLLYREVGLAFLAGVMVAIILIPLNKKLVREAMEGIRAVKASAWEPFFEKKISELREKELKYLKARKYLDAVCVYLWASAPLLITICILTTYTLCLQERLTAAKAFTCLALVNILIMPLNAFPWVLNGLVEALVSLRRLTRLFALNNMDVHDVYTLSGDVDTLMYVREGNFFWRGSKNAISGVSFHGKKGKIIGISGDVGSGKSTLLLGLLGETKSLTECIGITQESVSSGIGYVGQERWLYRGTVRDNIIAGKDFDPKLYDAVLKMTCLQRDINLMPGGDLYEISDNGATLSGGQRTRVALARALYQDNSMYLFDEPLASLDRRVADYVWVEAIEKRLRDRGRLVIVATHDARLLARADEVIVLGGDGKVVNKGTPQEVFGVEATEFGADEEDTGAETELERIILQDEERQVGTVKASVVGAYMHATGPILSTVIMVALFLMQFSKNAADWWLSRWTEGQGNFTDNSEHTSMSNLLYGPRQIDLLDDAQMDRSVYFLIIYGCIATANTIFTCIRAFLFAYGGIQAARHLHSNLLHKLLKASASWWDRTPSGRVINRICSDVYTCDDNLPFQLNILLASLFNLIGTMVITIMGLPLMTPVILLLLTVYYFIQKYYRLTTVELKRLTSLSLSPFYSHLCDTVNGLVTIRAQRFVDRFAKELRERLTINLRAQFSSLAASQWLSIRLSLIAVSIVAAIALSAVVQHQLLGVDSGLVALAITYALSLTGLLNGLLGSFIETEKEMVSVERINDYLTNIAEEEDKGEAQPPSEFSGNIELRNVFLRYSRYLPLALDSVNVSIAAGEKVAIIGRTGSGKTTLLQALLRTVSIESGQILLDNVDISTLSLPVLRRVFGVVPQHPFIFSGSLYENLAVGCESATEDQVANIARVARLESLMTRIGGLDGQIEESGKNLSFGERQIISICRVLLAKCKVVLIDEATSHLDATVHQRMMSLIATHLPKATVICITHVMHGLSDFDTVIEMANGKVISKGPPSPASISHEIRP
ncbi:ABC transporter, ATP-binding protein [Oesophagostomum dentatum]|uniref:ABC-type xenobiotic transporter n=1 Tax=Oesophagostomum dentatum TaxID=61180 RepID=A0A0B1TAZ0_OESDE|nr:ABC transporter, ATP-binding protein [Oesophagostomum dentatum]